MLSATTKESKWRQLFQIVLVSGSGFSVVFQCSCENSKTRSTLVQIVQPTLEQSNRVSSD